MGQNVHNQMTNLMIWCDRVEKKKVSNAKATTKITPTYN